MSDVFISIILIVWGVSLVLTYKRGYTNGWNNGVRTTKRAAIKMLVEMKRK